MTVELIVKNSNATFYVLDQVSSLYKLAAVEHAVLRTTNWANLLDLSDLEILEFASDLKVCLSRDSLWLPSSAGILQLWFLLNFFLLSFFLTYCQRLQIGCLTYFHTLCGISANLECRSERCCTRLAANVEPQKVAKNRHLGTIPQLCRAISSQLRHVSTIGKKLVKQQYLLYMS